MSLDKQQLPMRIVLLAVQVKIHLTGEKIVSAPKRKAKTRKLMKCVSTMYIECVET
jgi:hypothetical protein